MVYGLWGVQRIVSGRALRQGRVDSGVILAIMITPRSSRSPAKSLPRCRASQKEGVLALGATKWETIRFAILPYNTGRHRRAMMLGLARAVGETMAVTMVIGNSAGQIKPSLLSSRSNYRQHHRQPVREYNLTLHESALIELGLVLLVVASCLTLPRVCSLD